LGGFFAAFLAARDHDESPGFSPRGLVVDEVLPKAGMKLVKTLLTQSCVKSVGLPTHTSKKPVFGYRKPSSPDISSPLGDLLSIEKLAWCFS
jgi:hypothetical protein